MGDRKIDCGTRQGYKLSVVMAPCERWSWVWGNTP